MSTQKKKTVNAINDKNGDVFNAEKFADKLAGQRLYSPARKQWLYYDAGLRWRWDELRNITQEAIRVTQDLVQDAGLALVKAGQIIDKEARDTAIKKAEALLKHARASQNKGRLDAMVSLAATDPRMSVSTGELDGDDALLGVQNGVIELAGGQFRAGAAGDKITKCAGAEWVGSVDDPQVFYPAWQKFLVEILPDEETRAWLQKFVGYCLSGETGEQVFLVLHGHGANGKSVFIDTARMLLGSYATTARFETFCDQKGANGAIRNDLAALDKIRLVIANEGADGARLDEGVVKAITGGDEIRARFLYGEEFSYTPRFKLVLVSNHKPVIRGTDHGIWRRIVLVPFGVTIPAEQRDKGLQDKLRAEMPGILAWAVEGYRMWREQGLSKLPAEIQRANTAYRTDSDTLGRWLEECVEIDPAAFTPNTEVRQSYKAWCAEYGFGEMNDTNLGNKLREKGFDNGPRQRGQRGWTGFRIASKGY